LKIVTKSRIHFFKKDINTHTTNHLHPHSNTYIYQNNSLHAITLHNHTYMQSHSHKQTHSEIFTIIHRKRLTIRALIKFYDCIHLVIDRLSFGMNRHLNDLKRFLNIVIVPH